MIRHHLQLGFYHQDCKKLPHMFGNEVIFWSHFHVATLVNNFLRDRLFRLLNSDWMTLLADRFLLPPLSCFFLNLPSHVFSSCLEVLFTTDKVSNFRYCESYHISTDASSSWDNNFFQERNSISPITWARAPNPRPRCLPTPL